MASVRVELIHAAFEALLTGAKVQADLQRRGDSIARSAGAGFVARPFRMTYGGSPRAGVTVRAETPAARRAQARDRVLNKAIDAGR